MTTDPWTLAERNERKDTVTQIHTPGDPWDNARDHFMKAAEPQPVERPTPEIPPLPESASYLNSPEGHNLLLRGMTDPESLTDAEKKQIKLEDVAKHYGYTITKTRLDKALDGVLSSEPTPA